MKGVRTTEEKRVNGQRKKRHISFFGKVFLIITISIMTPIYLVFLYLNSSFSSFLDEEISNKVSQTIANSEEQIYTKQETLINVSNVFFGDQEFRKTMVDPSKNYYERCKQFDQVIAQLTNNNIFGVEDLKITYFDQDKNIYTNWNINFKDYTFLLEEEWLQRENVQDGYLVWNLFEKSPFIGEEDKNIRYISLGRFFRGEVNGTLIISMSVERLNQILKKYQFSENDLLYICSVKQREGLGYTPDVTLQHDMKQIYHKLTGQSGCFMDEVNQNKYIVYYYSLSDSLYYNDDDFKVVALIDYQKVNEKTQNYLFKTSLLFIAFSFFLLVVVYFISRTIVHPIKDISQKVSEYKVKDQFQYEYHPNDEIGELYEAFANMTSNINELFDSLDREYRIKEKYRFESLRAQINPHFIFNTLNSIRWMAIICKQDNIVESIDALTDMLQYSMSKGSNMVTLKQELESIEAYIYIQNMRYGEGCHTTVQIPDKLYSCQMIKFSLQPIVENCFIHGFKDMGGKAVILIQGYIEENHLIIEISNNGVLVSDQMIEKFEQSKRKEHRDTMQVTGIGMTNVDEIIKVTYGSTYGITILKRNNMTVVRYTLPYIITEEIE